LGWFLIVIGIPMMPLPGPGLVVLVAGVAILAKHYSWARGILEPLRRRAMVAASASVESRKRIVLGLAGGLWIFVLGIVWIVGPLIPEFDLLVLHLGPRLPGEGWAVGLGLIVSALAAWTALGWAIRRFRSGSAGVPVSEDSAAA
jgi:hypothetical protein